MEIILITASLAGMGLYQLWQWVGAGMGINDRTRYYGLGAMILLALMAHIAHADKWRMFDDYRSSPMQKILELTDKINEIDAKGVTAVGIHPVLASGVHYFTNKDIVYFSPETVEELIQDGRLKEAFSVYDIELAAGFSKNASAKIKEQTGAEVILLNSDSD